MFFFPPFSYECSKKDHFFEYLHSLKEFRDYATSERKDSVFLNHQKIIGRFVGPYTHGPAYENILILHDVGTGKSGIVCCIFEEYYQFYKNDFNFIYLSNNDVTKNNFKEEFKKLSPTFQKLSVEMEHSKSVRFHQIFITKYSNTDLARLENKIQSFENQTIIVIDEVHNLVNRESIEERQQSRTKIRRVQEFLQKFHKKKLIFMTGTPIRHQVDEIIPIFSLLLNRSISMNIFDQNNWLESFQNILQKVSISYYRKKNSENLKIIYQQPTQPNLQDLNQEMFHDIFFQNMTKYQSDVYLKHLFDVDEKRKITTMDERLLHRHAVIVDESFFLQKIKRAKSQQQKLDVLKDHSIIFYNVMHQIIQNPSQKVFVYCKYIEYAGIEIFVKILECFGKKHGTDFIRLSCESRCSVCNLQVATCLCDEKQIGLKTKELVESFNHSQRIKIIIGSDNQSEGISFLDIEQIHVISPWWNFGRTKQAIGRGIRFNSHRNLILKKKKDCLFNLLSNEYQQQQHKDSFRMFLEQKYRENFDSNDLIQLEKEDTLLEKLLLLENYTNQIQEPEIHIRIFLHCALPNQSQYDLMKSKIAPEKPHSMFDIVQYKQYQKSSEQENKIKNLMYEIYLNSFDYLLNLYNNEISDGDTYFKNVSKSKPCRSRQDSIIHDENYNDLYLEEKNSIWVRKIFDFLETYFNKSPCSKSFQEILLHFQHQEPHCSHVELGHALLTILSKNMTFVLGDQKVFLRFQNNYFYLSHEKTSEKYITEETNVLPPFYGIPSKKNRTRNYNIENIKEVLNYKRKLSELNIDLENFEKREFGTKDMNKINTLPKKIRYQIGFRQNNNGEESKKDILAQVANTPRFVELQNSLQKNLIGIRIKNNFFIYFIHEVHFKLNSKKLYELMHCLFKTVTNSYKNQFGKVLKVYYENISPDPNLAWPVKLDMILKTLQEYEKIKNQNRNNIFQLDWSDALQEIENFLSRSEFSEKKGLKKLFAIDTSTNFLKDCKFKFDGKNIYHEYHDQYVIWINVQIINYNLQQFEFFENNSIMEKWERFCKTYLMDKRLDSTGRNIQSIYFPKLYQIFTEYLTDDEKTTIKDLLQSYENYTVEKTEQQRPKNLNIDLWREKLIEFLHNRKQIF